MHPFCRQDTRRSTTGSHIAWFDMLGVGQVSVGLGGFSWLHEMVTLLVVAFCASRTLASRQVVALFQLAQWASLSFFAGQGSFQISLQRGALLCGATGTILQLRRRSVEGKTTPRFGVTCHHTPVDQPRQISNPRIGDVRPMRARGFCVFLGVNQT